ncbi:MAG: cation-translocating P-type ATPase [Proteobacteria bacterium]|nr:cation-translocating P-type ATPase [Pseudomonadota bacterium]
MKWHQRTVEDSYSHLGTRREGLTEQEVIVRRAEHGGNVLEEAPPRSPMAMLAAQFADFMVLILICAAIVSGLIGDLTDTLIIAAIVVLNAVLGFAQEFRAEHAMAALKGMSAPSANVVRGGTNAIIAASELVPGDVVALDAGRIVPADMRLVEVATLRVNESALTGESVPVDKTVEPIVTADLPVGDRRNMAHKGGFVTYGRGVGLVVATGMRTEFGSIARLLADARAVQTPLQRRLESFGRRLALIILLICAIVFVTGLLRGEAALPTLLLSLSLAVAAIPEALPAVVSIALAIGARKMLMNRALIRSLPAVETLGSVTFICSDKTGTLTANEMRVEQYFCDGERTGELRATCAAQTLLLAMAVSHDAVRDGSGEITGDPTEVALLVAAESAGLRRDTAEAGAPRVAELPFDSDRKCMSTVHRQSDGTFLSISKGAAEVIIAACVREQRLSGVVDVDRAELSQHADRMAADGLRVLGVAVRRWSSLPVDISPHCLESDLDFVGFVGLIDPPRPEVSDAIATCKAAGIVAVMITGDHPLTARAVARRLGLIEASGRVMTGPQLAALSSEEFERRAREVRVYARVAPEQKVKIVTALQAAGEVVAMTGDGVNDAPALKRADVGVAMGIQGTDVAKEAAAIVLLDDNFATIVRAIREGRRIYDNLRRFVRYVLTTNSAEVWVIFLAPFLGLPVPLLAIQILWINLVTDGLPGLALASEPAERDLMMRPPRPPKESLFARGLGAHAFVVGLLMAGLVLALQAWYWHAGLAEWQTVVFTALCFTQLAHVMAIRSEVTPLFALGLGSNRPLLATVLFTIGLQLALVYVPAFNLLFKTVPLRATELAACVGAALIILLAVELEKWARNRRLG